MTAMPDDALPDRIADQFSYRDDRADIWRAFDLVLDTDRFLNLGYAPRFVPYLLGSSQRRLVDHVGSVLASSLPATRGVSLLDLGCGRGGPAIRLAERHGFRVTGIDLVPYNVRRARAHAEGATASFVVGDAATLPFRSGSMAAATSIDAVVYLPRKTVVFAEVARALGPGGVLVGSDLVAASGATDGGREALDAFAAAWDMPPLPTVEGYERALRDGGFEVDSVSDITAHSVGRFRAWTALYRGLTAGPVDRVVDALLRRAGLDATAIDRQIVSAHEALPWLRHLVFVARVPEE